MAQLFKPSANTLARLSLLVGGALPVLLLFGGSAVTRSSANTKVGVAPEQPIPFSHSHHAFELGIDCRYCHTGVEKGSFAGFPPIETCMSCHSQIWTNSPMLQPLRDAWKSKTPIVWNRVNDIPEFAYFDHSIHVNRGINCNVCHGPVQKMPLMYKGQAFQMVWCLNCHREPNKYIYKDPDHPELTPRQQVFNLYWKYQANAKMSPQERDIINGGNLSKNSVDPHEGLAMAAERGIKTKQLEDCWICHR